DPAALFLAIIPRRSLRRLAITLEHPVAELAAHAHDAPQEAVIHQPLELADAGKEQLVLDDSVLHAAGARCLRELERLGRGGRKRLLAVDALPRRDRAAHMTAAQARHRSLAADLSRWRREPGVQIGRDA